MKNQEIRVFFWGSYIFWRKTETEVLKNHILTAPRNASYLGHRTQNEMIIIIVNAIRFMTFWKLKCTELWWTKPVTFLTQTKLLVIRYVQKGTSETQERLFSLVTAEQKTGEALETLLLKVLQDSTLSLNNIVGECYDGGSNFAAAVRGVQNRIREKKWKRDFYTLLFPCLNRAAVNSLNHKNFPKLASFSLFQSLFFFSKKLATG